MFSEVEQAERASQLQKFAEEKKLADAALERRRTKGNGAARRGFVMVAESDTGLDAESGALMLGSLKTQEPPKARVATTHTPVSDELRKFLQLKNICCIAKAIAARHNGQGPQRTAAYELRNYRNHASEAIGLAREITDEIYRHSAMYYLIDLFMEARDEAYAKKLFDVMKAGPIRERILRVYPQLGEAA